MQRGAETKIPPINKRYLRKNKKPPGTVFLYYIPINDRFSFLFDKIAKIFLLSAFAFL